MTELAELFLGRDLGCPLGSGLGCARPIDRQRQCRPRRRKPRGSFPTLIEPRLTVRLEELTAHLQCGEAEREKHLAHQIERLVDLLRRIGEYWSSTLRRLTEVERLLNPDNGLATRHTRRQPMGIDL